MEVETRRPKKEVTSGTLWQCQVCGQCCKENWGIFVVENDLKRWMREGRYDIILNVVPVLRTEVKRFGFMSTPVGCIYLSQDNKCQIHDTKPESCQTYPFYLTNNRLFYDSSCPGIGKGQRIRLEELRRLIRKHYLALERSGHEGFLKLFSKAQRKAFKKIPASKEKYKTLEFFQEGKYDGYFVLDLKGSRYSIVSLNLKNEIPPKEVLSRWIESAAEKLQAKAIAGILRVISSKERNMIAIYCFVPARVADPRKIVITVQFIMTDARARAALESEGHKFVLWDELYP
jgi:Fe-S-cluster containining protein